MKTAKQHYEEWMHVLPNFTEEQKRKLYFMMNDYAIYYHKNEVEKLIKCLDCGSSNVNVEYEGHYKTCLDCGRKW